ncbi:hypothetical protein SEPCBS57363_000546 [Sporothrix epigloea]|uniref:Early meiotic induction protein 1 n=1 Tax=Sporothrix epigloea TaxID=1892477 RepID=A0ABP0D5L0_9PEZI
MGWFWSSDLLPGEVAATSQKSPKTSSHPVAATTTSALPPAEVATKVHDGIPDNDPEVSKFVAMFQSGEFGRQDSQQVDPAVGRAAAQTPNDDRPLSAVGDTNEKRENLDIRERSLAEATLPVSMSCRQAFDLAWACQSPAGQWRAVYRHGGVRPCSDLWDDFWFCMRVKGYAEGPLKEEAVRSHYRKKEIDRYYLPGQPSSEDVWRTRTIDEVLPPGAVFQQNFQVVGGDQAQPKEAHDDDGREDATHVLADAERRRSIRQDMGYEK